MGSAPIDVGSDRQLFIDDFFFAEKDGVELRIHSPRTENVAVPSDKPWENASVHYSSVVRDGDRFQMWYRSDVGTAVTDDAWTTYGCYAESSDGIDWEKPSLGLVEFDGSKDNNIVLPTESVVGANPTVIIDPNAPAEEKYKMITRQRAIWAYTSADGVNWKGVETNPILTKGPFDSHNVLIWDDERETYVIYSRGVGMSQAGAFRKGHRAIRRSESKDFLHWSELETVLEADDRDPDGFNMYTNSCVKYHRAARSYFMFPTLLWLGRQYPGTPAEGLSDVQLAVSRDGISWTRYREPFVTPGRDESNWVDRNPFIGAGMLETAPDELSLYYSERYRSGSPEVRFRRCTVRTDGFVSVHAPYDGWSEFTTPPMTFSGSEFEMNYATAGGGSILVELQDENGNAFPGFMLEECNLFFGDKIDGMVSWKGGADVGLLSGRPVRMRVRMRDADLYAFKFR